jgi:hypothetical protein
MKRAIVVALAALGTYAGTAQAGCGPAERLDEAALGKLLAGNTVCGRPVKPAYAGDAKDRWQEEHHGAAPGGAMWDYKKGDGDKIDPRKQVGTWTILSIAPGVFAVEHAYIGGASFRWTVHSIPSEPGSYSFCQRTTEFVRGKVKLGINVGCTAGDFPP